MNANRNSAIPVIFAISALLFVSLACGSSPAASTQPASIENTSLPVNTPVPVNTTVPIPTDTTIPIPTDTSLPPTATVNPNLIEPGTYLIGTDIQPGIYKGFAGPDPSVTCYWERLKDLTGSFDAILANSNSYGQFFVEVKKSDYAFTTACELELLVSLPVHTGDYPQLIGPGTYLVGREIQPGLYKGQAGSDVMSSCYWERLRNVAGGFDAILANDNATGQYYVQVAASDFALTTACELTFVKK